eukprot:m.197794 g.197794  ORF g.197794 m.197794 type:complete len:97 (-) comp17026_c0_seq4:184-474(-)
MGVAVIVICASICAAGAVYILSQCFIRLWRLSKHANVELQPASALPTAPSIDWSITRLETVQSWLDPETCCICMEPLSYMTTARVGVLYHWAPFVS